MMMDLIHNLQTEKEQRQWLEQYVPKELIQSLCHQSEAEMMAIDQEWVHLIQKTKQLPGTPVGHPEVKT